MTQSQIQIEASPRRRRARKIRSPLGPFATSCKTFERGRDREIEIVRITPAVAVVRLKGCSEEYACPWTVVYQRGVAAAANFNPDGLKRRR